MKDRFRFRAWDKDLKSYWKPGNFDLQKAVEDKSLIVEQCTGLKDKTGRLIYEGDIVESTRYNRNNKPARDVVEYDYEFAGFFPMCDYDCDCGIYNNADELVVVGNIHENPELLEAQK